MSVLWPKGVAHRFFGRTGGCSRPPYDSLNVGSAVGDEASAVLRNRQIVQDLFGCGASPLVFANQVHGKDVAIIASGMPAEPPAADILLTTAEANVGLALYTADCAPILLAHPRAIAAAHGGWRGAKEGVAAAAVAALCELASAAPSELVVAIGPTIGPCCYWVRADVAQPLRAALGRDSEPLLLAKSLEHTAVDLPGLHRLALQKAGVLAAQISQAGACTACSGTFFSHRRDGARSGRQASAIGFL